tara:strand:- start:515 stop:1339 length:825 start_codon:yes stop_codon:yes gene_type:complete
MPEDITKSYLKKKQYSTTKYLEARIKIHQFTKNKYSFHEWILNNFDMSVFSKDRPIKVLDVGCGTGVFWKKNVQKLNQFKLDVVFTDFTQAMVDKEKENTKDIEGTKVYEIADVENLEKYYGKFDIVMCHNVIYHAQDKNNALMNLEKCLNDDLNSFCSITTNSEKHMLNVYENGRNLDKNFPTDRIIDTFTEEIADKLIPNFFKMDKRLEEEELQVTDWDILMGFVASGVEPRGIKLVDNFYDKYKEIFENEMKSKGYFQIIKRSPLYICKKK